MDIEQIMSFKNSFQNQRFQLVKGKGPKLGKVFEVMDIDQGRGGIYAELSDGTKIGISQLTSDYLMVMDDQPAMSMAEIMSINSDNIAEIGTINPAEISPELQIPDELKADIIKQATVQQSAPVQQPATQAAPKPQVQEADLFGMFALEETTVNITVKAKLPSKSLLKAMYAGAQDKNEFVNKLSLYINNSVSADSIKDSLWKMLDPEKKKQLNDKSS